MHTKEIRKLGEIDALRGTMRTFQNVGNIHLKAKQKACELPRPDLCEKCVERLRDMAKISAEMEESE